MKYHNNDESEPFHLGGGPPGKFDTPLNKLEEALIELSQRQLHVPGFMEIFLNSDVYIVLPKGQLDTVGEQTKLVQDPKAFSLKHTRYNALCLYSHPSRIKPTKERFPEFKYEFCVPAGRFIFGIDENIGITINPYWDINFEWNGEQISVMRKKMKLKEPEPELGYEASVGEHA